MLYLHYNLKTKIMAKKIFFIAVLILFCTFVGFISGVITENARYDNALIEAGQEPLINYFE